LRSRTTACVANVQFSARQGFFMSRCVYGVSSVSQGFVHKSVHMASVCQLRTVPKAYDQDCGDGIPDQRSGGRLSEAQRDYDGSRHAGPTAWNERPLAPRERDSVNKCSGVPSCPEVFTSCRRNHCVTVTLTAARPRIRLGRHGSDLRAHRRRKRRHGRSAHRPDPCGPLLIHPRLNTPRSPNTL